MHYNCLIIDDEVPLAESTAEYFNLFDVTAAYVFDSNSALQFLDENTTDLILLDINLGQISGFTLCKKLRELTQIPILFISARSSDDDILIALNIGGDDYIQKPYSLSILLAKVKAVLKRIPKNTSMHTDLYTFHNVTIDYKLQKVTVGGQELRLKAMEYKLLCYLIQHKNRIISKEELFEKVWGDSITGDGTLNVHIRHIREKIEENPNEPRFIKTIWGTGYLFEEG
ncbi:MAG: DNA-binding response regulator [Herbinix sp.]|jgi:two-component system response regulator RegX3|nr:DNA-binding response regulator [Herbinix sp.]